MKQYTVLGESKRRSLIAGRGIWSSEQVYYELHMLVGSENMGKVAGQVYIVECTECVQCLNAAYTAYTEAYPYNFFRVEAIILA